MTPDRKRHLRELCALATREPWVQGDGRRNDRCQVMAGQKVVATVASVVDRALICEAPTAIRELLDEVERLEGEASNAYYEDLESW